MLYLTGASSSLKKSDYAPQEDVSKSLGGYVSSSPVPNGSTNGLFDLISMLSLKNKQEETIGIALINKLPTPVYNVELKMVGDIDNICGFKIAAVSLDDNLCMEHIENRYQEPIQAEFYDATFYHASVDVTIVKSAIADETIIFNPFGVSVDVSEGTISGTANAIVDAFSNDSTYTAKKIADNIVRIERRDDTKLDTPLDCSYVSSDGAEFSFSSKFKNIKDNSVLLVEQLNSGDGIGIWLKRDFSNIQNRSNEKIIEDYDNGVELETKEKTELVISYNLNNE